METCAPAERGAARRAHAVAPSAPPSPPLPLTPRSIKKLYAYINPKNNTKAPLIADDVYQAVLSNAAQLDAAMEYSRDYDYDYFGFKARLRARGGAGA